MKIESGKSYWSELFNKRVDVLRVYKKTATIRIWGGGLMEGKQMTFRGHDLTDLKPIKR